LPKTSRARRTFSPFHGHRPNTPAGPARRPWCRHRHRNGSPRRAADRGDGGLCPGRQDAWHLPLYRQAQILLAKSRHQSTTPLANEGTELKRACAIHVVSPASTWFGPWPGGSNERPDFSVTGSEAAPPAIGKADRRSRERFWRDERAAGPRAKRGMGER
jgi:hypothetical protein